MCIPPRLEAGYQRVDYDDGGDNHGWKVTLSQNISIAMGPEFRPMLRFYVTGGEVDNKRTARINGTTDTTLDSFNVGAMWEASGSDVKTGGGPPQPPPVKLCTCVMMRALLISNQHDRVGLDDGFHEKGMLCVLAAAVLWGSSGVCAQYIMEKSHISSPWLTMTRLLFTGVILLTLSFVHGDKIFAILKSRKDTFSLLFFRCLAH